MSLLPRELRAAIASGDILIFLGAGFSRPAGVPLWPEALAEIGHRLRNHDDGYGSLVQREAEAGRLLEAADLIYAAPITADQRRELLARVFDCPVNITAGQRSLVKIPCQGFVTTNFDRVAKRAAADSGVDLVQFTESPSDLAQARVCGRTFLAHIHGRIESPDGMILARRHYERLTENDAYVEFFRELFLNRNVLFFGFSFADPVLSSLIRQMSKAVSSAFRRQAYATFSGALPASLDPVLREAGIVPVVYDPAGDHRVIWDAILEAEHAARPAPIEREPVARVKSEFAAVYARAHSRRFSADRIQILSGLLLATLSDIGAGNEITIRDFEGRVRRSLALPVAVSRVDILDAARRLESDRCLRIDGAVIHVEKLPETPELGPDLDRLVQGVEAAAEVRHGYKRGADHKSQLKEVVLTTLLIDGLHVAHALIRGSPLDQGNVRGSIDRAIDLVGRGPLPSELIDAFSRLLARPDRLQEEVLEKIASVAFSSSLLLGDPIRATHVQAGSESGIFLDASIVLPWISEGYPLSQPYGTLIESFGRGGKFIVDGYLNELVSHRKLAVETFAEARLDDPERLERFVLLYEAHGMNTFIGGYALRRQGGFGGSFDEYLDDCAPFDTEDGAARYLERRGIEAVDPRAKVDSYRLAGGPLFGELKAAFRDLRRPRAEIVIRHDAAQLELMLAQSEDPDAEFLISADKALMSAAARTRAAQVLRKVLLPQEAAYLAQFAGVGESVITGISRAMWMSPRDLGDRLRDYYIDRILKEYEYALIEDMPTIVDRILSEIDRDVGGLDDSVSLEESEQEKVRVFNAMDRFEPRFYEQMLAAKRERGLL